jgi:hypothetical protein
MLEQLRNRITVQARSDSGIGMILVIGIVIFGAGLTATAGVIAMNGLSQSRHRISFEQALASAESGVDFALGKLQYAFDTDFVDYPIPLADTAPTAACTAADIQLPAAANDPQTWDEQAWAEQQLDTLEAGPLGANGRPTCLMATPTGDVLILKPRNAAGGPGLKYGRVYARGWAPGWGDPRAIERTVKVEYVFMPFQPKHAVLTGSNLSLQGSFLVDEANGVDPNTAGVHTNGNLEIEGSGGDVSGPVTYIGTVDGSTTFSGGDAAQVKVPVRIPVVSARQLYKQAPSRGEVDSSSWWDLCPDGTARVYSSAGPCTGGPHPLGTGGWSFSGSSPADHLWTANRDTLDGTYFVYQADATNGSGNPDFTSITVIAAATEPASPGNCPSPRYGGNIIWDHYAVGIPHFGDLWFLADQDLVVHANFDAGSNGDTPIAGTYIAGEEIDLQTSSSMLVGSVLAANQCPNDSGPIEGDENNVQGQEIWFKPNADSPFSSVISTTLWLEY